MSKRHVKTFSQFADPLYENKVKSGIYKVYEADDELSSAQKNYQELMAVALLKFGAESPADLDTQGKKDMFNWIKDNWDKDKGEASAEAQDLIKKAKEKDLMPSEPKAAMSDDEQEEEKAKKAKEKKEKVAKALGEE